MDLMRGLPMDSPERPFGGGESIAVAPDAREAARRIAAACLAHAQANEAGGSISVITPMSIRLRAT